jgi:hypothetical protein
MQASDWMSVHMGVIDVGSFVIPTWYVIAMAIAALAYYGGFRNHSRVL